MGARNCVADKKIRAAGFGLSKAMGLRVMMKRYDWQTGVRLRRPRTGAVIELRRQAGVARTYCLLRSERPILPFRSRSERTTLSPNERPTRKPARFLPSSQSSPRKQNAGGDWGSADGWRDVAPCVFSQVTSLGHIRRPTGACFYGLLAKREVLLPRDKAPCRAAW